MQIKQYLFNWVTIYQTKDELLIPVWTLIENPSNPW